MDKNNKEPGGDLLSHEEPHTIMGAEWFHGRVREGIGCFTNAIATRQKGVKMVQRQGKV